MLHMMKVDEGSNDDETFVESFLNFCGGYSLMFPSRIVEKKLYLPLAAWVSSQVSRWHCRTKNIEMIWELHQSEATIVHKSQAGKKLCEQNYSVQWPSVASAFIKQRG